MPEKSPEKIGDSEVEDSKRVGGFVVKYLKPSMPDGPIMPGSEEARAIINEVAEKLKVPRKFKTTTKPEFSFPKDEED